VTGRIRVLALAVVRRGDELLVHGGEDEVKGERFHRLPGGEIELGERGEDAVHRELREEIAVELAGVRYLGTVENLFTYRGDAGHEVALLFEAGLADETLYAREGFPIVEPGGEATEMYWADPADGLPLYPTGAVELANRSRGQARA
jgi:ADP-ribose pyrophosphatase YjhB (NUDIX family)